MKPLKLSYYPGILDSIVANGIRDPINSFMTEILIILKPVHWFAWFLYDRDLRHKSLI